MTVHEDPADCNGHINYHDDWETITFGAYRYGTCTICDRTFREYYTYTHLETPDVPTDEEPTIIWKR